ncbi:MAG TPA: dUTPase, partial [Candidatus Limnocylindria bacterium]|nr:dUTPase [Candidatus Limnocylindria bacterium]
WMQKYALALIAEVSEALDETNYKWWKNPKPVDLPALREELVDVLHFFLSMCLEAGMDAEEIHRIYMAKCAENFARQDGTSTKPGYAPQEDNSVGQTP